MTGFPKTHPGRDPLLALMLHRAGVAAIETVGRLYEALVALGRRLGKASFSRRAKIRGSSNAKAKRELGWTLKYPSWGVGFRDGL